jgi:hypothetical protein
MSSGLMILVEGDEPDEWFSAMEWQRRRFLEVMQFGCMKSMGQPNPKEETDIFKYENYEYRFIIYDDWGPCFIKNMTTGKEREIIYMEVCKKNAGFMDSKLYNVPSKLTRF